MMTQIYFLCTGNACRSQMAEGFAKKILGNDWRVASAGVEAASDVYKRQPYVETLVIAVQSPHQRSRKSIGHFQTRL